MTIHDFIIESIQISQLVNVNGKAQFFNYIMSEEQEWYLAKLVTLPNFTAIIKLDTITAKQNQKPVKEQHRQPHLSSKQVGVDDIDPHFFFLSSTHIIIITKIKNQKQVIYN